MVSYPPLKAVRYFEAAARHLSFSKAAEELSVTHSAISHQIKALEGWLGVPLFERGTRQVALTPAMCLHERRIGGADVTVRFPRAWLEDWRSVADGIDRLIAGFRPAVVPG